jgi:hypothetical protein
MTIFSVQIKHWGLSSSSMAASAVAGGGTAAVALPAWRSIGSVAAMVRGARGFAVAPAAPAAVASGFSFLRLLLWWWWLSLLALLVEGPFSGLDDESFCPLRRFLLRDWSDDDEDAAALAGEGVGVEGSMEMFRLWCSESSAEQRPDDGRREEGKRRKKGRRKGGEEVGKERMKGKRKRDEQKKRNIKSMSAADRLLIWKNKRKKKCDDWSTNFQPPQ